MNAEKSIFDLGRREGRLLFFGGVYSNFQALEALKTWADGNGYAPENIFCTGDVLGYCAQPVETIQLIREWNINLIAGNVELQLRDGEENCGCSFKAGGRCDVFSRNWYAYAQSKIGQEDNDWLHTLPHHVRFGYAGRKVFLAHGSWFDTSEFIFKSTGWETKAGNFSATGADLIIAGHAGLPFADKHEGLLWLNAGAIGMPANDGNSSTWFATMDQQADATPPHHRFHQLSYNHQRAAQLMKANGLPLAYANTLQTGIWDNCEILPPQEATQQGKPVLPTSPGAA